MQTQERFPDIIGQETIKRRLSFYISVFEKTGKFPHCLFCGSKGMGKSMLSSMVAGYLGRDYYEINARTISGVTALWDEVLIPLVINQDVTLFFDEAHALDAGVMDILLSLLAPNSSGINTVRYNSIPYEFNTARFSVLFATTEAQKLPPPLKSRLKEIHLADYTNLDLQLIIQKHCKIELSLHVLGFISNFIKNNARGAFDMAEEISNYCILEGRSTFSLIDARDLIKILNVYEFGLSALEIQILQSMAKAGAASLTRLAAKSGLTGSAQREFEKSLLSLDLIEIDGQRKITRTGVEYLNRNL